MPSDEYFKKQVFSKNTANYKIVPRGAFAYNPSRINVGSIDYLRQEAAVLVSPLYIVFRTSDELHPSYLKRFLLSEAGLAQINHHTQGAVRDSLKFVGLQKIEIPLPSPKEQKRIAAVLDKADALRRQRQESLQLTEKLLQSVFIDMFVKNPDSADWQPRSVGWMAKETKGSMRTGPFGSQLLHSEFVDQGIAVLGIDNAVKNRFEWSQPRFITPKKYEALRRYKVFPGDLIITIMGTLGRCAIVPDDIPEAINTKHLCCITLDHSRCIPAFLHAAFLYHPAVFRQLGVRTKGAVMPGLNMGIIKDIKLPMPPVEHQEKFERFTALALASQADLEASLAATDNLFSSLQQRAFRGELDLSRLVLDDDLIQAVDDLHHLTHQVFPAALGVSPSAMAWVPPVKVERALKKLDRSVNQGDQIAWSPNYFKYRILAAQAAPFSFGDLMQKAETVFDESPPYEEIKGMTFDLLGQDERPALLRQYFDLQTDPETNEVSGRKEIVFEPAP